MMNGVVTIRGGTLHSAVHKNQHSASRLRSDGVHPKEEVAYICQMQRSDVWQLLAFLSEGRDQGFYGSLSHSQKKPTVPFQSSRLIVLKFGVFLSQASIPPLVPCIAFSHKVSADGEQQTSLRETHIPNHCKMSDSSICFHLLLLIPVVYFRARVVARLNCLNINKNCFLQNLSPRKMHSAPICPQINPCALSTA